MNIIDTHSHLCDAVFDKDLQEVLKRAEEKDVRAIISVSENLVDTQKNLQLSRAHPQIFPAAGLYPTELDLDQAKVIGEFIRKNRKYIVAIGEVGLDYWKVKEESLREVQRAVFLYFIRLSKELDLSLNVHSRSAGRHTIAMLLQANAGKVQLHAFDGKPQAARDAIEAGYYFSIPPSVIRSRQKQKLVRQLPLENILVETDSPVLGPDPNERNEPANAWLVLQAISEIKGVSMEKVAEAAYLNTLNLYGLDIK